MTKLNGSYQEEYKNLELMKIRFKEQSLHQCDVMLRDIKESERLNAQFKKEAIAKRTATDQSMLPLERIKTNIISPSYWPQSIEYGETQTDFVLPDKLAESFKNFSQVY